MPFFMIVTISMMLIFTGTHKRLDFQCIRKKLIRAMIAGILFSIIGFMIIYNIIGLTALMNITIYIFIDTMILILSFMFLIKNKYCAIMITLLAIISIQYFKAFGIDEYAHPLLTTLIYMQSILYIDIFWDGVLATFSYQDQNIEIE